MSRARRALACLATVLAVAAFGGSRARAQQPAELRLEAVDARAFPVVSVVITPPPALYGIVPSSITVLENGTPRPASVRLLAQDPLQVLLVVDTSGSMRGVPLEAAKQAAAAFIEALPPTTGTAVLGFAAAPALASAFSDDPMTAMAALEGLQAGGETALYDAVVAALGVFPADDGGRRFIVLLSDGGDTVSTTSLADAVARIRASDVGFYAVELQTVESDPASLEALAGVSAGRVVSAQDPTALTAVYHQIASELTNQLLVTYASLRGGAVDLTITVGQGEVSAAGSASFVLPETVVSTTTATTTTATTQAGQAATTTLVASGPPPTYVGSSPGRFGSPWALPLGLAAVFLAAFTVIALLLMPGDRPPSQLVSVIQERFTPSGGLLTRAADRAKGIAERAFNRGDRPSRLGRALDSAGVRLSAGEFGILAICAAIVGLALGTLLLRLPGALIFGAIGLIAPRLWVIHLEQKRRQAFADQLDGTLQLLAGSLRAGYGLLQSVSTVASEAAAPTSEEFSRIMVETRLGRDLVDALTALADRMESQDFRWVAQAIGIQRSVGGDLVEILDTVGQTIRERNQIRRQIKALSAEGRISSYILFAIPIFLAGFILIVAPDFISPLWTTSAGKIAVAVAATLWVVGVVWIRRLIRLRF